MKTKICGLIAAAVCILAGHVAAESRVPDPLDVAFYSSDAVMSVFVHKVTARYIVNGELCGHESEVTVLARFKGEEKVGERITIGRSGHLTPLSSYLLFLKRVGYADERLAQAMAETDSRMQKEELHEHFLCDGLVPGYEFDWRYEWKFAAEGGLFRLGLLPQEWPASISYTNPSPGYYFMSEKDMATYLKKLCVTDVSCKD